MRSLIIVLALTRLAIAVPAQPARPAAEVASALQARYEQTRDFSADFIHTYEGGLLGMQVTERGVVLVKKPGMMRWSYESPERKLFVSDGEHIYSYVPADRQVMISALPEGDQATTAVLFLAGRGDLVRDFDVSYAAVPEQPPDTHALQLTPRQAERDYQTLTLVVEAQSLRIRQIVSHDRQGGISTIEFANLKENIGLADNQFAFTIPRGVDVIESGGAPG